MLVGLPDVDVTSVEDSIVAVVFRLRQVVLLQGPICFFIIKVGDLDKFAKEIDLGNHKELTFLDLPGVMLDGVALSSVDESEAVRRLQSFKIQLKDDLGGVTAGVEEKH